MIAAVRRALALLDRRDRWRWVALVPLAVAGAAVEAAGAAAVFLLVRALAGGAATPQALAWLPLPDNRGVVALAAIIVAFYLARTVVLLAIQFMQDRVVERTAARLAVGLLRRYLLAPWPFHFARSSSTLLHAIRDSVDTVVEHVLAASVRIASEGLVVAGLLALLAAAAPAETIAAVAALAILLVAPLGLMRRTYARWGDEERRTGERMVAHLQQSLDTVKQIAVSGRQEYFSVRYARDRALLERLKIRRSIGSTALRLGVETVFICAMVLAVVMMSASGRSGPDAVAVLSLFAYAGFRVVPSANRVILNVNMLRFGAPYVSALVDDWQHVAIDAGSSPTMFPTLSREIECQGIAFTYQGSTTPALHGVSCRIAAGTSLGVVGPTGAGKSTFVDILIGLLVPTAGRVLVDGQDIFGAWGGWRAQVGYVPQNVMLLDDTLRRNVAFGLHDQQIDEDRLTRAVSSAQLAPLVALLPHGLDTPIGERGIRLSGGERQRIAIARALYDDPAVLVFDEATAALDAQTEREVVDAIDRSKGRRTVIAIAHRLTTVRGCDSIIVLDRGRVAAQGTYEELLAGSELFRTLV